MNSSNGTDTPPQDQLPLQNDPSRQQKRSLNETEPEPPLSLTARQENDFPSPAEFGPKLKRVKTQPSEELADSLLDDLSRNQNAPEAETHHVGNTYAEGDSRDRDDAHENPENTDDDEAGPGTDETSSVKNGPTKINTSDRPRSTSPKPYSPNCDTPQTPNSPSNAKRTSSQSPSPSPQSPVVQKRKPGRPRRKKMPAQAAVSDLGVLDDEQEEIIGKIDELGEKKISKDGELLDGREFRVRTFLSPTRNPSRLYMFGLDAAKLLGYRDSYLFFHRNKQIKKIWTTDVEKLYLISESLLIPQLKNRPVALVTAHTIFVNFGSKVVKNARIGIDDYYETDLLGKPEWGRLLHKPLPPVPKGDEGTPSSFSYGASTDDLRAGGSGPSVLILAPASPEKFKSTQPNSIDWMYQCAASTRDFNKRLLAIRKVKQANLFSGNQQTATDEKPMGFWDWHTNMHQVPRLTQCTNVRIERCDVAEGTANKSAHGGKNALQVEKDVRFTALEDRPRGRLLDDDLHANEMGRIFNDYVPHALNENVPPVEDLTEAAMRLYPLRIMDRQWVGAVSVHNTRFCKDDVVEPRPSVKRPVSADLLAASMMATSSGLTLTQPAEEYNPGMEQLRKKMAASSSIFCRYPNRIGQPCQRLVTYEGERCLYHKETAEKGSDAGSINESVKGGEVTKADKKPNPPTNPIPEKNTTPAFVPPPNLNICVHCRCVRTPSVLIPGSNEDDRTAPSEKDEPISNGDDEKSGNADANLKDVSLPFDLEMTIQCSKCKYRYHPLCANISSAKVIAAVVGGGGTVSVQGKSGLNENGESVETEGESTRDPSDVHAEGSGNSGTSNSWQCNDCKVCVVCADAEDEASLLICDGCDRGWHMRCCRTEVEEVPQGRWLCSICSRCHTCNNTKLLLQNVRKGTMEGSVNAEGSSATIVSSSGPKGTPSPRKRSPTRKTQRKPPPVFPVSCFHAVQTPSDPPTATRPTFLATYCTLCHSDFEQDHYCPVCLKTFSEEDPVMEEEAAKVIESGGWDIGMDLDTDMVCCDRCDRWIHKRCDVRMRDDRWFRKIGKKGVQYFCPLCEVEKRTNPSKPSDRKEEVLEGEVEPVEEGEKKTETGAETETETKADASEDGRKSPRPTVFEFLDPKSTPPIRGVVNYKGKLIGMPVIPDGVKEVREARASKAEGGYGRGDGLA